MNHSSVKTRDYFFDNYKALLIVLVVIGHFIEPSYEHNSFLYVLKWLIVSFHMPAFIFISGYFSKRELTASALFRKLVVPYITYELIYYLLYTLILHKKTELYLLYPKFSLWYILSLFFWRLVTPYVKKIPNYMVWAIAAGLLIGCIQMPSNFLTIPRTFVFYPFFLAGTIFDRELITRLKNPRNQFVALIGILLFILYLIFNPNYKDLSPKIFYGRYNYDYLGQDPAEGILCRLICYMVGFTMTLAVGLLISMKKNLFSFMGTRTMAIYLFHGLSYSCLKSAGVLGHVNTFLDTFLLLLFCVLLALVFSAPKLTEFTNRIAGFPSFKTMVLETHTDSAQSEVMERPGYF